MVFSFTCFAKAFFRIMLFSIVLFFVTGQPSVATAADTKQDEFRNILRDSLNDLWADREFSPELVRRQQIMKTMMSNNEVEKVVFERMLEKAVIDILERQRTSRYALKNMPGGVNNLFSPHMDWKTFRAVLWREISSVVQDDDPIMITIGTLAPPGTPWITLPETVIIPELEQLTAGKLRIKIYSGGVLGDDADVLHKLEGHHVDGCGCTALGVLEASPETSVLLIPGLFQNYEEVDYILEKIRKRLDQSFEERGYILVGIIDTGFLYMFSKYKISNLVDMKGQRTVKWFGATESILYQDLGIEAVHMTVPEVVSALNMGLADNILLPPAWVLGMQAYQYANFYLKQPLLYSPAAIFVGNYTKERLQKQLGVSEIFTHNVKEVLVYEFNVREPEWKRQLRYYEAKSLKAFESKCGMKSISLTPEALQTIRETGRAVRQKLAGKAFPEDLMNDVLKALEEYRSGRR